MRFALNEKTSSHLVIWYMVYGIWLYGVSKAIQKKVGRRARLPCQYEEYDGHY